MSNLTGGLLIALFFVLPGSGTAAWGLAMLNRRLEVRRHGSRAVGKVIRLEESPSSEGGPSHAAVIAFHTADGIEHTCRTDYGTSHPRVGESIDVAYDPAHPDEGDPVLAAALIFPASVALMGLIFAVVGILCECALWLKSHRVD